MSYTYEKTNLPERYARLVSDHLHGERNGKSVGDKSNIAHKDVEIIVTHNIFGSGTT